MEKAKDMYQRKIRFPEDVRQAVERNGREESRQFNTELIYQLRKAYGLIGESNGQASKQRSPEVR
ncbi:Arc family DNA-binding protein [Cedecea davisae]|uniref:Arc family DNA-binding protein n=1 Tax=Cedecea davisae TaxID=158484 RepID=UPI00242EEB1A|nr:Arc family DNA-binding protein [Cedecea davisae]